MEPFPVSDLRLRAFLAPNLDRLDAAERAEVYALCREVARVGDAAGYDVDDPYVARHGRPEEEIAGEVWAERERILAADLLLHLSHFPPRGSGTGEFWDFAFHAGLPQLLLGRGETEARRLVSWTPAPKYETEYAAAEGLPGALHRTLDLLRPFLSERRLLRHPAAAHRHLGARARQRRAELHLSVEEVAAASRLPVALVERIEAGAPAPGLAEVRALAVGLKLTLAELCDVAATIPALRDRLD